MDQISAIIVDDEPRAVEEIGHLLGDFMEISVVGSYTRPAEAMTAIQKLKPEVLFLDIQMPGMDGFEMLTKIRPVLPQAKIIFTTAFDSYMIQAIRNAAFDYLLKPIDRVELGNTVLRLIQTREGDIQSKIDLLLSSLKDTRKIKIESRGGFLMVDPSEIVYFLADWSYTEVYLTGDRKEVMTMNIGKVAEMLPRNGFFRISRSIIINTQYLCRVNRLHKKCMLKCEEKEYSFTLTRKALRDMENGLQ